MKKENKKLAQAQRAAQRKKEARKNLIKNIVTFSIPALIIVALIILIVWDPFSKATNTDSSSSTDTDYTSSDDSSTDTSSTENTYTPESLDESLTYYADIKIKDYGTITVKLDQKSAPISAANFVALAEDGFYDGLTFHRIIEGFMMQGGDPEGNGTGGSENNIVGEFTANGYDNNLSHTRGAISMARSSAYNSASSQFFIVHEDCSDSLDGDYAVFGYVTEGIEIVDKVCEDSNPTDDNGTIEADEQPIISSVTIRTK